MILFEIIDHVDNGASWFGKILDIQFATAGRICRRDDEKPLVFGEVPTDIPPRGTRTAKDEGIFALRGLQFMEEKLVLIGHARKGTPFLRLFITTVIQPLIDRKSTRLNSSH